MYVQELKLDKGKRYMLIDNHGIPILPVMKYLKYLDNTGKSSNTQRTYCYALKNYFLYLEEIGKDYRLIRLEDLSNFIGWLRNPHQCIKVVPLTQVRAQRTEGTVNLTITIITNFYDFLFRHEEIAQDICEKLMRQAFVGGTKGYKDFLHHISKDKSISTNILKIKEPRRRIQILTKEQVQQLLEATTNIRDEFLLRLLFETGLRIGEALSLFLEDFKFDQSRGHRICLKNRGELENEARLKTGEREIFISQSLMDLYDDYLYEVVDELEIESNFVFIKLRGQNIGKAMTYTDVNALFKTLRQKTNIEVHPHLLRHAHATLLYQETKNIKQVQERLGHSQIQTTINLYLHPSEEEIRKEWEKAQGAFQIN